MGKAARPFPTGHFRLYKTRQTKNDRPLVVQIEYAVKSVAVRRSTGISVKEKDWNPNENKGRGGVRASYGPDYRNINSRLTKSVSEFDSKIAAWCEKHPDRLTVEMMRALLDDHPTTREDKGIDFVSYVSDLLKNELDRNKIGQSVYRNGLSAMKIFREFLKSEKRGTYAPDSIYISEISTELIESHIKWRREIKDNSDDTINHALTPILKGCQQAMVMGYIPVALNAAIQKMRIIKTVSLQKNDESSVKHLSKKELECLIKFYTEDKEARRKEYIEMFLFALYACGLRVIDIITLQWSDIDFDKRTLNKIQVKTKNRNVIPLSDQAMGILEQWKGRYNRFVFGLLDDDFNLDDTDALYRVRNTKTRGINQALNVIGEKLGLSFSLTFHVGRHTFAVLSLNNGMDMTMVSQLLGHSSTEITEKVYAHFIPARLREELSKIKLPSL